MPAPKPAAGGRFSFASKNAFAFVFLIFNAFVWYFFVNSILKEVVEGLQVNGTTMAAIWVAHYGGIIGSAVLGYKLLASFRNRTQFMTFWVFLGVAASAISIVVDKTVPENVLLLSLFLGVSLGVGMPTCMKYFTESIRIDRRGTMGGLVLLLSGVGMFFLGTISSGNLPLETQILTSWRLLGLAPVLALRVWKEETPSKRSPSPSYKTVLSQRPFVLYFIPWLMFSLIIYLTIPIQASLVDRPTLEFFMLVESVLSGAFAVLGGFFSDRMGRKRIAISGFALLGVAYSILGIFYQNPYSWVLYSVFDGVAGGLLYVVFIMTLWGDLGNESSSDKYYAIGVLPFFMSKFLQYVIGGDLVLQISVSTIFSFTAFFLFLAVLPLAYAPETLPDKVIKDRDLKSYVEKAKKKVQAETEKEEKPECKKTDEEPKDDFIKFEVKPEDNQDEYEEARKLAEKYY
jgi:MFS family permease